jgi:hypothetical protein
MTCAGDWGHGRAGGDGAASEAGSAVGLLARRGMGRWMINLLIDSTATTGYEACDLAAQHDISIVLL